MAVRHWWVVPCPSTAPVWGGLRTAGSAYDIIIIHYYYYVLAAQLCLSAPCRDTWHGAKQGVKNGRYGAFEPDHHGEKRKEL